MLSQIYKNENIIPDNEKNIVKLKIVYNKGNTILFAYFE